MNTFVMNDRGHTLRYQDLYSTKNALGPLVFIHGLGCASSSDYPPVAASGPYPECRSILVDLMGAGFSDKPADGKYASDAQAAVLSSFIVGQHVTEVRLFGHSAGAFIALKLAKYLPVPVDTLILCAPGLTDYGISMLSGITSMSEAQFVNGGFHYSRSYCFVY
ncbi:alpha/beta fold hydrolase [Paraburkholderia lycopersici]|uniref:Alpha/beta hydrolase family protein n=1 Tax=Paraburkholderia lycopersici TaxID=416944 RepID=A0A1G6MCA3_9BURK|nr:alpha/beta hydrolase [Paraburkholderia lycopersici]SDC53212.1 Alpha/beta hydrolase family protein [Paraburkholderia lycopersici]